MATRAPSARQQMRDAVTDSLAGAADDGALSGKIEVHGFRLSKKACRVAMEDSFQNVLRVSLCFPIADQPFVAKQRIICAKHDAVLEPARDLVTQIGSMVFRRPAVQLVPDVPLMHQHRDHFGLPRPSRARGDDL